MKVIEQRNCMDIQAVKRENVGKVFIAQAGDIIEIELDAVKQLVEGVHRRQLMNNMKIEINKDQTFNEY